MTSIKKKYGFYLKRSVTFGKTKKPPCKKKKPGQNEAIGRSTGMSADYATGRYKRGRGFRLSGMERGLLLGASAVGLFAAWHQALANTVWLCGRSLTRLQESNDQLLIGTEGGDRAHEERQAPARA